MRHINIFPLEDSKNVIYTSFCANPKCINRTNSKEYIYCSIGCYRIHRHDKSKKCAIIDCKEKAHHTKYCSKQCYKKAMDILYYRDKRCKHCKEPIKSSRRKLLIFCSNNCYLNFYKNKIKDIKCENLNCKHGDKNIREMVDRKGKFCSRECYKECRSANEGKKLIRKRRNCFRRYILIKKRYMLMSTYNWTNNNGQIPVGYYVWFKDGETLNDDIDNLFLCKNSFKKSKNSSTNI